MLFVGQGIAFTIMCLRSARLSWTLHSPATTSCLRAGLYLILLRSSSIVSSKIRNVCVWL